MKERLLDYFKNDRHYWWTVGLLPGLYMIIYLYRKNFFQVNSVEQLLGLGFYFLVIPCLTVVLLDFLLKRYAPSRRAQFYFLALAIQGSLAITYMRYQYLRLIIIVILIGAAIVLSFLIAKHYKKFVFLFGVMLILALISWSPFFYRSITYRAEWVNQQKFDGIRFSKKPNIYLIQPDGYASASALRNSKYNFDNSLFETYLADEGFTIYPDYRSNYPSTLSSNATLFTARHHFLNYSTTYNELPAARDIIMADNPVLRSLKANGYNTVFISSTNYLQLNHNQPLYDYTSLQNSDISVIPSFVDGLDYYEPLNKYTGKRYCGST